jgi:hypothetical protein
MKDEHLQQIFNCFSSSLRQWLTFFNISATDVIPECIRNIYLKETEKVNETPCPESVSEPYGPSYRHLSAKLILKFADRGCHVVRERDRSLRP